MAPVTYWRNPALDMRVAPPPPAGYATAVHARPVGPAAAPAGINYHTYAPNSTIRPNTWALPKGTHLGYTKLKGYYALPGAAPAAAGPGAPTDPWSLMLAQVMAKGSAIWETPAQQEARVNREIDTQMAAAKKMYDDEYQRQIRVAQANALGMSAAGAAAASMSQDLFGKVGGEFNAGAKEMQGLAHGLSKGAAAATASDVSGANAALGALGNAPVTQGGTFGVGGDLQQGVEEYRGGTLAAQMLNTQGEAANFGLAGMISSENLQAVEESRASLMKATQDANDAQNKAIQALAAGRGDLFHQYMADAQDAKIKQISLAQGLQASMMAGVNKPLTKTVKGVLLQYDPLTQGWKKVYGTPTKPAAVHLQTKEFADGIWSWNPVTGKKVRFLGKPKPGTPPNLTYHDVLEADGKWHTVGFDPKTGARVPGVDLGVSKTQGPAPKTGKTPTAGQTDKLLNDWYHGKTGSTTYQPKDPKTGKGLVDAAGNPVYKSMPSAPGSPGEGQLSYQQAYKRLRTMHYNDQQARNMLDVYWHKGERGRPWLLANERKIAGAANYYRDGVYHKQPFIGPRMTSLFREHGILPDGYQGDKGHFFPRPGMTIAYLTPAQVQKMTAAGLVVPPGAMIDGRYFLQQSA